MTELLPGYEKFTWTNLWSQKCPNCGAYLTVGEEEYECMTSNCGFVIGFVDFDKMKTILKKPWRK